MYDRIAARATELSDRSSRSAIRRSAAASAAGTLTLMMSPGPTSVRAEKRADAAKETILSDLNH
jgi:hypothetical protein